MLKVKVQQLSAILLFTRVLILDLTLVEDLARNSSHSLTGLIFYSSLYLKAIVQHIHVYLCRYNAYTYTTVCKSQIKHAHHQTWNFANKFHTMICGNFRGRRIQALSWTTEGFSAAKLKKAEIERNSRDLKDMALKVSKKSIVV